MKPSRKTIRRRNKIAQLQRLADEGPLCVAHHPRRSAEASPTRGPRKPREVLAPNPPTPEPTWVPLAIVGSFLFLCIIYFLG